MPGILTQTERNDELSVLLKSGWEMVENRDAIYKKFKFKSFIPSKTDCDMYLKCEVSPLTILPIARIASYFSVA